jgi:hypothetical protein
MIGLKVLHKLAERLGNDPEGSPESKGETNFTSGDSFALPQFNEGGSIDEQMQMAMAIGPEEEEQETLPDDDMEDDYLDFIMSEALSQEEEQMLTSKLEQDEELAMLFDKVIDVAQEFAGSGPVEGPGSGVSDSIPARLSDGEFVMTAKAAEVMGPENLQELMMEAENAADRQAMFTGGPVTRDKEREDMAKNGSVKKVEQTINVSQPQVDSSGATVVQDDDLVSEELTKLALYNREGAHIHS